jgi:hypothetical protein
LEIESSGQLIPFDEYNTDWIFTAERDSFPLIEDLSYKNFTAIRLGDVDGSLEFLNDNLMRENNEKLSYNMVPEGSLIKVPVKLKNEYVIDNIDLHLNYNHDLLTLESIEVNQDNLPDDVYQLVSNTVGYKDLVAIYSISTVDEYKEGVLVDLYFRLKDKYYDINAATIDLSRIVVNSDLGAAGFLMDDTNNLYDSIVFGEPEEVSGFMFHPCYPNPFNPSVNIEFSLPERSDVKVDIFNSRGQRVSQIYSGQSSKGLNKFTFNADHLSSGVYFVKVSSSENSMVQKVLLLK